MATPIVTLGRCCIRSLRLRPSHPRSISATIAYRSRLGARRWENTNAAVADPKVTQIVDQISQLTLLETADLVSTLKVSLGYFCPHFCIGSRKSIFFVN